MKLSGILLICFALLTVARSAVAQQSYQEVWDSAQTMYAQGNYSAAVKHYEEFLRSKPSSFSGTYNLGTCYLQQRNIPLAILWYERARKLKPQDRDLLYNLAIAKARRIDPVVEIREFFLLRWLRLLSGYLPATGWAWLSLTVFWFFAIQCYRRIKSGDWKYRWWLLTIPALLFIVTLSLGAQRGRDLRRTDRAVVIRDRAAVRIAPEAKSKLVTDINGGEVVQILDTLNAYCKVRLANFEHGWIAIESIERI